MRQILSRKFIYFSFSKECLHPFSKYFLLFGFSLSLPWLFPWLPRHTVPAVKATAKVTKDQDFSTQRRKTSVGQRLILSPAVTQKGGVKTPPVTLFANVFSTALAASATSTITSSLIPKVPFFYHPFSFYFIFTLYFLLGPPYFPNCISERTVFLGIMFIT